MKKVIFGILSLLLVASSLTAQDGKRAYKDASKALNSFNLGGQTETADLKEAMAKIEIAIEDEEMSQDAKVWNTRGEIYNAVVSNYMTMRMIGGEEKEVEILDKAAALKAYESFSKALEMADKRWHENDAIKGLTETANNLMNMGVEEYESGNYAKAYLDFNAVLDIRETLKEKGESSVLEKEEDYLNQLYITGLAALNANMMDEAKPFFEQLYEIEYDKPAVYDALYKIKAQDDQEAALAILETGREKYPDDVSLLFTEINHYLSVGKMDVLVDKLKTAIEKEPNNVSLYSTMGNVYDNLYQKALESGDEEKQEEYFNEALKYYSQALEKKPDFFDAMYSIGALYYNKAAGFTQQMNAMAEDYSKEGMKKYEAAKEKMFAQFDEALPYFKKAEQLNPNDRNTLIALKEIYARKDQLEMSNVFKERLDTIESGGEVSESYFATEGK